jgi:hypothetical protein
MYFVRTLSTANESHVEPAAELLPSAAEEDQSFSWAIQYDDSSPHVSVRYLFPDLNFIYLFNSILPLGKNRL